jgi:hypothetical protein
VLTPQPSGEPPEGEGAAAEEQKEQGDAAARPMAVLPLPRCRCLCSPPAPTRSVLRGWHTHPVPVPVPHETLTPAPLAAPLVAGPWPHSSVAGGALDDARRHTSAPSWFLPLPPLPPVDHRVILGDDGHRRLAAVIDAYLRALAR